MGRLGCPEELMLHVFSTIVSLADSFGYFRLTEKMLFIERSQVRVWIHEDVFRNMPLMPIISGAEGEKHFVIAFLALA